jgi:ferrous iron transport protein B
VVVDATQPGRHLPLLLQVLRCGFRAAVALTMNDLARGAGAALDPSRLSQALGVPVVDVDGRTGEGTVELVSCVESMLDGPSDAAGVLPRSATDAQIQDDFRRADSVARSALVAGAPTARDWSRRIDSVALHPVFGIVLFCAAMTALFWSVSSAASPFMELVDGAFSRLGAGLARILPDAWWARFLVEGLVAGAGAVLVFVPQIAILFLGIGLLEDSGYLARGAMLVDRFLSALGLNGKSFVPLLSGNACAIPAAMAARTIPGRRERLLTLLVVPLMSCSARLPVWGLLLAFLVPPGKAWAGGLALAAIYLASLAFASVAALVGGKVLRIPPSASGFQLELPAWRLPAWRTVLLSALDRTRSYLRRAGLTILGVSALFWLFMNLPTQEHSAAFWLGRHMEPLFEPMGLDWRVGVALIAAFAAREVFVSALAVVFAVQGAEQSTNGLLAAMRGAVFPDGHHVFTTSSAVGLVVFFLVALQCLTTVAVMRREASTRFALGQMAAFILVAWILASLTVQGLRLVGVA